MLKTATIKNLQEGFEVVKAMRTEGLDWSEGYRPLGRRSWRRSLRGVRAESVAETLLSLPVG